MPTTNHQSTCLWCQKPLPAPKKHGRPRAYCSDNCRKYAAAHRKAHQENKQPIKAVYQPYEVTTTVLKRPTIDQVLQAYKQDPQFAIELTKTLIRMMKINPASYHYDHQSLEKFTAAFSEVLFYWYAQMKLPSTEQFSFPSYAGIWRNNQVYTDEELEEFFRANRYFDENLEGLLGTQGALKKFEEKLQYWEKSYHAEQKKQLAELDEKNMKYGSVMGIKERVFKEENQFLRHQNNLLRYELKQEHAYSQVLLEWMRQNCDEQTREIIFQAIRNKHNNEEAPKRFRKSYVYQLRERLKMYRGVAQNLIEIHHLDWVEDKTPLESTGIDEEFVEFLAENSLDQQEDLRASCPSGPIDFEQSRREHEGSEALMAQWEAEGLFDGLDKSEESEEVADLKRQVAEYDVNNRQLFIAAFERQEETRKLRAQVEELEKQNRNLLDKLRRAKRKR